jgi:CheY-like chemotaxis protein
MALILLIEDNADMLQALTEALEINQHEVIPARTGAEGLQVLEKLNQLPDLIITDVRMPQMDGLTFLQNVRGNPQWSNIPIALMSGQARDMTTAAGVGANAFIPKPFKFQQLEETLDRLLV